MNKEFDELFYNSQIIYIYIFSSIVAKCIGYM
jgi:hypothetical protein